MADKKITELPNINGADLVDADEFVVVDISADETKAITLAELKNAFDAGTGFVRVTGDTMTGVLVMPDGTNSAPSISNTGDTNTGMFFGAADTVSFTAGGTKRLDINTTGIDVTGNMVVSGTVDGVDVATRDGVLTSTTTTANAALPKAGGGMTGAITTNSTFDGRDVATDGTKLDGIEASADVTDATNVTAAGALMDSELTNIAAVKALNQGLATTDEVAFDNTSLNAIATDISDTAVDVFVYDTSKDSDGGAWRKRTQNTSWYNEAASATRGSRKEFPAVAVLVYEEDQVTIYDGDDPDLPMWMVFNASSSGNFNLLGSTSRTTSALAALNAEFMFCSTNNQNQTYINFITDFGCLIYASGSNMDIYNGNIAERNAQKHYHGGTVNRIKTSIINRNVNDVAMTVLPNAPIDAATGLPVPTIAVATDGGVSVIKDDGTVVDITGASNYNYSKYLSFLPDNKLIYTLDYSTYSRFIRVDNIPSADFSATSASDQVGNSLELYALYLGLGNLNWLGPNTSATNYVCKNNIGSTTGLTILDRNPTSPANGMVAYTASDYNTGWMNGAIKLATLSDTDDTNVTGAELVTNGTMESNSGWGALGSPVSQNQSNAIAHSGTYSWKFVTSGNYQGIKSASDMSVVSGKTYVINSWVYPVNDTGIAVRFGGVLQVVTGLTQGAWNEVTVTVIATSTSSTSYVQFDTNVNFGSGTWYIDDVSVRLAEEDRSVNGNGLQVFGTVTKTAVATGADLVAYSGFSGSNYLQQPYNSDLDFGTGDFCYIWWANIPATSFQAHFTREYHNGSAFIGPSIEVFSDAAGKLRLYMSDDGFGTYDTWTSAASISGMQCFAVARRGGVIDTYIDGAFDNTHTISAPAGSMNNTSAKLFVGIQGNLSSVSGGSIALLRISATAPSPEQIAKIYNDEKHLFQTGAQATLYGTSDAVTALAYDDSTDLLHVGTSAGRSTFQGLRRVENTTTAVGTTISASNGLVAED